MCIRDSRKIVTSQTAKGRIAVMTVAAGAVSTAGVGGAAAANIQSDDAATTKTQSVDFELASDSTQVEDAAANPVDTTPQILNVAEAKPVADLTDQLNKAIQASEERAAADEAARAPSVARPAEGAFTSPFAMRWGAFHKGIDIANSLGTPILAVMDLSLIHI